ncbi:MAG: branched-chain amino acid ABC transporter permease [Alphaproteobacteria bacterium HGW-Alphaproteobacteria-1]|jgi:branched-subunit amino acid ABC-type transport system permease component|nr:MAG: branched-chain amino acid ABC transporter permease [Alphaproteobacteria bacterium HGW-Alphaproteobacteria-1]
MDVTLQILFSGLTLGAVYAVSTVGLALVFGALNMLNMAHGALLALGGYACMWAMQSLGLPAPLAALVAMAVGAAVGGAIFVLAARPMLGQEGFETRIFIATIGIGLVLENVIHKFFGPQPQAQPLKLDGGMMFGRVNLPWQNVLIFVTAVLMMVGVAMLLGRSRLGRAIRATSMNRDAAQLMGVPIRRIYALILMLSGALAALSGIMISSMSSLLPNMGADPMLKAFIICVVAGLGNVPGAAGVAFALGILEALIQYVFGVQYAFAILLCLVIVVLIWRPQGIFGEREVIRL